MAMIGPWLRCYRCWSLDLEVQERYEGVHRLDPAARGTLRVASPAEESRPPAATGELPH